MKVLLCSDLHLDWENDGVDRFDDLAALLDVTVDQAIGLEVDFWACLGDLCNPNTGRSHRAIAKAVAVDKKLREHEVFPLWLTGNHDVVEDGTGAHTMLEISAAGGYVLDRPGRGLLTADSGAQLRYLALPYTPRSHSYDPDQAVRAAKADDRKPEIPMLVMGHLCLEGITPGGETTDQPRGREVFWPLEALKECYPDAILIGGHYHTRQQYKGVNIVGSLGRVTRQPGLDDPGFYVLEV